MIYNKKRDEVFEILQTSNEGLSHKEVLTRQQKYGKNILPKKKQDSFFKIFFRELRDPMVLLLFGAIIVSLIVGELIDAISIAFIVFIDVILGTIQENKANHSTDALAKFVESKVKVIRENEIQIILASELTIGDLVLLGSGDRVSADMRIIEVDHLLVDESILTGESVPVYKDCIEISEKDVLISDQSNMLFSGTTIVKGRAKAIVVQIGLNTEIGHIALSIDETKEEKSPLTIRIEKLSKQISFLILGIGFLITLLLIFKGVPYHEIFLSVIALSISAMPEGLPLALTMALTIATNKMAKKNVIVKKLKSAESLGSCTVIASDKTGTLTVNRQTAKKIILPNGYEYNLMESENEGKMSSKYVKNIQEIGLCGILNNEAKFSENNYVGDSIDVAFQLLGEKLNVEVKNHKILSSIPYESENKYSAVFYEYDGEIYCTVKGSYEVVKSFCKDISLSSSFSQLEDQNINFAKAGYRVIAIAKGKIKKKNQFQAKDIKNLTFLGMVGFIDPVRKEAIPSVLECHEAGIQVLMITGDHPLTAYSIAKELGIANSYSDITDGNEIEQELKKTSASFDQFIRKKKVFARVTPIQKLKIVESLKRQGEFVAVTGDGVNDAPALKSANIGIAMGSGTDIAHEVADMIIVDDNFKSIVTGIKEGRVAYANIRKIIFFLISCGFSEVFFFCFSILMNLPMPLVAIQLLWINMVTDGIQDFALSFEKGEKDILKQPPRNPKDSIFDKSFVQEILASGFVIGVIVFGAWYFLLNMLHMDVVIARGYIMALMVFIQNIHVFNCRSERDSAFHISLKSNWIILIGIILSILLQFLVMEVPLFSQFLQTTSIPFISLLFLFVISLLVLFIMEIYKMLFFKEKNK